MRSIPIRFYFFLFMILGFSTVAHSQELTALEIIKKAEDRLQGESSFAEINMSIVRPSWTRDMELKAWSMGTEYSLILVTSPVRDKGVATLKREKEIWNWQPSIDRTIKLPPSMMMQSWMGSDFTNDDLVKESSIIEDYDHSILGSEIIGDRDCYKIELIPKEDAAVVWGRVISWISKENFIQMKHEFYDEDDYLVQTMLGKEIMVLGGKLLPSILEVIPAEEEGHKTVITYKSLEYNVDLTLRFFSVQNMKRVE